ncbi:protein-methionine-sulfoxide reductase catalytic subunit MsrP [Paracandidimonas soli]|uniref:Protein-methionine-sulfoxide reductase catalytic subunit MsrP n=1 Tax=Paracandidimonas soli TaxID=1917182 RepID=A0A4R3V2S8_9BURK|nr:protein-methionine-sulfoxide reductase catalytic subunit MsrP [Paracandidimonas soli]TCU99106.1 sulfoxide reductase catalytic subunit YedY [Paracandidimonas soli]
MANLNPSPPILPSAITPEPVWRSRRQLLAAAGLAATGLGWSGASRAQSQPDKPALAGKRNAALSVSEDLTPERDITTYNNFYEFGLDKEDPFLFSGPMKTEPWTIEVEGEVARPKVFGLDELLKLAPMEERIYRLRCVEAWSMVIPWMGYSLSALLRKVEPTGNAKYVEFVTDMQPEAMPGLRSRILRWPYRESLRMDEAMHPLTMLVYGLYGKQLPNQNGAPVRLAVPWKYGFKSAKSIVRIRVVEHLPMSSWMEVAPHEYGFYANVNPDVPHPRWSQAMERRIGGSVFAPRVRTQLFNGYADQVASLYAGLDLRQNY